MQQESFYMVFMEGGSAPTYKHPTMEVAEIEAKRLAKIHDKKTYVLCTLKSFEVQWYKVDDCRPQSFNELPF